MATIPDKDGEDKRGRLLRLRPSPSMVVSLAALFVALSGTTYALNGSNTVYTDDIVNGQVYSADVRDASLTGGGLTAADLRAGSVRSSKVQNGQIYSADVRDDSLAGGGLTAADLGADSVGPSELAGGAVDEGKLADGAVTPAKLGTIPAVRADTHWTPGFYCSEQAVANEAEVAIRFPTESFDTADMHSAANCTDPQGTTLVAPRDGIYQVSAGVVWSGNASGYRQIGLQRRSGAETSYLATQSAPALQGTPAPALLQQVSAIAKLNQGDTVELLGFQNSGGELQVAKGDSRNFLAMAWIGRP